LRRHPLLRYHFDHTVWRTDMRIMIDIDEADIKALDGLAQQQDVSRNAVIQNILANFFRSDCPDPMQAFGLWGDGAAEGQIYQTEIRDEWSRGQKDP
jgi:hypothetical protein